MSSFMDTHEAFTKFDYSDTRQSSMRNLAQLGIEGNVVFVGHQTGNNSTNLSHMMYSWFVPGEREGKWSYMHGVFESDGYTQSSWERSEEVQWTQCPVRKHLVNIVMDKVSLYTVPMSKVYYSFTDTIVQGGTNYRLYVKLDSGHYGEISYDEYGNMKVLSHSENDLSWNMVSLYSLSRNILVHTPKLEGDAWECDSCGSWGMYDGGTPHDMDSTPLSIVVPDNNENVTPEYPSSDEMSVCSDSDSDSDSDSESGSSETINIAEGIPLPPCYEDEGNVDESYREPRRYDEEFGEWYTKEEFYEYYGTHSVWDASHPVDHLKRRAIYWIFSMYGKKMPYKKIRLLVDEIMDTY